MRELFGSALGPSVEQLKIRAAKSNHIYRQTDIHICSDCVDKDVNVIRQHAMAMRENNCPTVPKFIISQRPFHDLVKARVLSMVKRSNILIL